MVFLVVAAKVVKVVAWIVLIGGLILLLDYSFLAMNGLLPDTKGETNEDHRADEEREEPGTIY